MSVQKGIPYGIDQRPMPKGDDLETLLPAEVGSFRRQAIRKLGDIHRDPIYADYQSAGGGTVFVELGLCGEASRAQQALNTARAETPDCEVHGWSVGTEPSFLKNSHPERGAFMAWSRGSYYFSAHARGGAEDLDAFMQSFPC